MYAYVIYISFKIICIKPDCISSWSELGFNQTCK